MNEENNFKSLHGANGQKSLLEIIKSLKEKKYISDYIKDYRIGYKDYDVSQFYFKYLIRFADNSEWILNSTTSIRTDRLKAQQWDSSNMKRLNAYIEKAYVVLADGADNKDVKEAENYTDKIKSHRMYSGIDEIITSTQFYNMVERKALSLMNDSGKALSYAGTNFEKMIAEVMSDQQNFRRWKYRDRAAAGNRFQLYIKIIKALNIDSTDVEKIYATTYIPKLPSGGNPKTDVCVTVETTSGIINYTFSCKRSSKDWVSAHEYSAEQFCNVLNPNDRILKNLLVEFQKVGGKTKFGKENEELLEKRLQKYARKLSEWVITGKHGEGEGIQIADYLIVYSEIFEPDTETGGFKYCGTRIDVHTSEEYINRIMDIPCGSKYMGHFGTAFRWTYPSKKLGKKIQLKMYIK